MQRVQPIKTAYGSMRGRDAIHLDSIQFENGTNALRLCGEINGRLCEDAPPGDWIPYTLVFDDVLVSHVTELDTWESQNDWYNESSFDEIIESKWISSMNGKVSPEHRHFILKTYDDVIEVICRDFNFALKQPRQNKTLEKAGEDRRP